MVNGIYLLILYFITVLNTTYINQNYVNIILHSWPCFGCNQPSSVQNRTKSRDTEGMHSLGYHIVHNSWYVKIVCKLILKWRKNKTSEIKYTSTGRNIEEELFCTYHIYDLDLSGLGLG